MRINRFLPLLVPLLAFLLAELFFWQPKMIYVSGVLIVLLFFFATRQFILEAKISERWWNFAILPTLFSLSLLAFSTMVPSAWLIQGFFVLNSVFLYFYFRTIYYYLIKPERYEKYSLENFSAYGNFLSFYFFASSIYGLQSFLNISVWLLMIAMLFAVTLMVYQVMWTNKINLQIGLFYVILSGIVLLELAWSISFLTLSYYILGLIIAVCYYILIGLVRFYLLGTLQKRQIKHYLIFGFSSIMIVLLTARWL